jgi:hypothetical protein
VASKIIHDQETSVSGKGITRTGRLFIFEDGSRLLVHYETDNPPGADFLEAVRLSELSQAGGVGAKLADQVEAQSANAIEFGDEYPKLAGLYTADEPIIKVNELTLEQELKMGLFDNELPDVSKWEWVNDDPGTIPPAFLDDQHEESEG